LRESQYVPLRDLWQERRHSIYRRPLLVSHNGGAWPTRVKNLLQFRVRPDVAVMTVNDQADKLANLLARLVGCPAEPRSSSLMVDADPSPAPERPLTGLMI
jgi:hypothetical protein